MSDVGDEAQAADELFRQVALAGRRAGMAADGRDDCQDCGEPIPAARRQALPGAVRCVFCQGQSETRTVGR